MLPAKHRSANSRFLVNGILRSPLAGIVFTILFNDGQESKLVATLAALKSATFGASDLPPSPAAGTAPDVLRTTSDATRFRLVVPAGHLEMTFPRAGFASTKPAISEGAPRNPRYFHFSDKKNGAQISGWFEPARSYGGFDAFWKNQPDAWQRGGAPTPKHVALAKVDGWELASYDFAVPSLGKAAVADAHIRAEWVQDGSWIDVHISVTGTRPTEEPQREAMDLLKSLRVTWKM